MALEAPLPVRGKASVALSFGALTAQALWLCYHPFCRSAKSCWLSMNIYGETKDMQYYQSISNGYIVFLSSQPEPFEM